jgi:peroxiredoxin
MIRAHYVRFLALLVLLIGAGFVVTARNAMTLIAADESGAFGFRTGELAADFRYRAIDGTRGSLFDLIAGHRAVVIAVRWSGCPVSRRYGHELARLEREFGEHGVAFLYLNPGLQDVGEGAREDIDAYGFAAPYVSDPDGRIAGQLQAAVSTEVFVIDASGTLRYRGAVDDQYGIGFGLPEARQRYLRAALDAVLAGEPVAIAETEASGCYLEHDTARGVPQRGITYHSRISRIVQQNCASCHRDGGIAPFSLESYEQVAGYRGMIRWVVEEGRMPPWFASPEHGEWRNDRSLSARDRRDLLAWIDAGAPEGEARDAVLALAWPDGWKLNREPDLVIPIPEPIDIPAEGVMDYQYVYVKTDFPEDRWLQKIDFRSTAQDVLHHVIVYLEAPDADRRGALLAGTAPGVPATVYPDGLAKRLPAGAWIMFELHYTPNGRATTDRSELGLVFASGPPQQVVRTGAVGTTEFEIPPHAADHEVVAQTTFRRPVRIISFLPHMHLRGKAFRYELVHPDGREEILLDVPRYDFNWQLSYEPRVPMQIQPGSVLRGRAWYDNSAGNPANPDPALAVGYGEQSFEEMMFGFFDFVRDDEAPPTPAAPPTASR